MRIFDRGLAAGALLLLAGCGNPATQTANANVLAQAEAQQAKAAEDDGNILCARGQGALQRACTIEQVKAGTA